jgi:hypothetical protein
MNGTFYTCGTGHFLKNSGVRDADKITPAHFCSFLFVFSALQKSLSRSIGTQLCRLEKKKNNLPTGRQAAPYDRVYFVFVPKGFFMTATEVLREEVKQYIDQADDKSLRIVILHDGSTKIFNHYRTHQNRFFSI